MSFAGATLGRALPDAAADGDAPPPPLLHAATNEATTKSVSTSGERGRSDDTETSG
jgi:hypothetical protein